MKVAIIGAGVAGLSCAFELKKHGIIPTIFEKQSSAGEAFNINVLTLKSFHRPITDPVRFLKKKYNLAINPICPLTSLTLTSESQSMNVKKNMGYIFKRGKDTTSIGSQLAAAVDLPIQFNTFVQSIDELRDRFTHIIVANGEANLVTQLNAWKPNFHTYIRTANIIGQFQMGHAQIWFNTRFSRQSFAFLVASSPKEAQLALIVDSISLSELDHYWKEFIGSEGKEYTITETCDLQFNTGNTHPLQIDNVYFTGNAGGFTDDFLGFGVLNSVYSGLMAAHSIGTGMNYTKLVHPIIEEINKLHELRKIMNTYDNRDFNKFIKILSNPIPKNAIYANPFFSIGHTAAIGKLYNRLTKNKA